MFLKVRSVWVLAALTLTFAVAQSRCNPIKTYPIPVEVPQKNSYDVKVRSPNGEWQAVGTYETRHHEINTTTGSAMTRTGSMAYFDFSGDVEVSVTYKAGSVVAARVRPDSLGIVPAVEANTISFTLDKPRNVVVHATTDVFDVLHLFSNPIVNETAAESDPDTIFYGPGYHTANGTIFVPSGKTLYLAGGAVLQASVNFDNATGVAMRGHGILYKSKDSTISVWHTHDLLVEDIIVLNPGHYTVNIAEAEDITIRGLRSFSAVQWGDGIDVFSSNNVLLDGLFMRNSDDCIALYNHRFDWYGDSSNITVQNSILWADVAHPINIGTHGNSVNPETMSGVTIRNLDILDHRELQMDYQGCIAINPGDSNLIADVLVEDVRVEDFRIGQLINMRVTYNQKYNTSPGRGISNVTVRNLSYRGTHAGTAVVAGYDETHGIEFVRFENLTINGGQISDKMKKPSWFLTTDFIPMYVNDHVKNLTFV